MTRLSQLLMLRVHFWNLTLWIYLLSSMAPNGMNDNLIPTPLSSELSVNSFLPDVNTSDVAGQLYILYIGNIVLVCGNALCCCGTFAVSQFHTNWIHYEVYTNCYVLLFLHLAYKKSMLFYHLFWQESVYNVQLWFLQRFNTFLWHNTNVWSLRFP